MLKQILNNVREKTPLVHCITNYVTVNDVANVLLAAGASPIMADDISEVAEITSICSALCINIGTLNERTIKSMLAAGKRANELGRPVVLDPVGAGASKLRTETTQSLMDEVKFSVIRGNLSEIKAAYGGAAGTRGVDVSEADLRSGIDSAITLAKEFSKKIGAVVVITGATDVIAQGDNVSLVSNGTPEMSKITGTGCMLSAVIAGYCGANPHSLHDAATAAVAMFGLSGERAAKAAVGMGSLRVGLIDEISKMDYDTFIGGVKIETR